MTTLPVIQKAAAVDQTANLRPVRYTADGRQVLKPAGNRPAHRQAEFRWHHDKVDALQLHARAEMGRDIPPAQTAVDAHLAPATVDVQLLRDPQHQQNPLRVLPVV